MSKNPLLGHGKNRPDIPKFNEVGSGSDSATTPETPVEEKKKTTRTTKTKKDTTAPNTDLIGGYQPPPKVTNKQVTIYLDTDVVEALDAWANSQQQVKGAKSGLINDILKRTFNIRQGG